MKKKKTYLILSNLLFWALYSMSFFLINKTYQVDHIIPHNLFTIIATQAFIVYFINHFLFPKFYEKGKQVPFFFISLLLIFYLIPVVRLLAMLLLKINVTFSRLFTTDLLILYFVTIVLVFISISIRLLKEREKEKKGISEIEKQKREIELFALKNQIDSHFLFNTLNNIYGLSLKKSDLAPKGILLLSDILSYVLYETKKDYYPLSSEVQLINNYIELEKMRWGDDIKIDFEITGNTSNSFITPLILFTFIENSFKHGISKTTENPWIKIKLAVRINEIFFEIENSIPEGLSAKLISRKDGIGFENIRRRLDLLYPKMYYLNTKIDNGVFYIGLTLISN